MKVQTPDEQAVNLSMFHRDGDLSWSNVGPNFPKVQRGRTDSKKTLGFLVTTPKGKEITAFVLNRAQVFELREYLGFQIRRLKKGGSPGLYALTARSRARAKKKKS